jgi:hypothetical protein
MPSSSLVEGWMNKTSNKIYSTIHLFNSQPLAIKVLGLLFLAFHICTFIFVVFVLGPEQVFDYTAQLAQYVRNLTFPRSTIIALTICVSFPPMIGYGTLMSLSGMAFGGSQKMKLENGTQVPAGSLWEAWVVAALSCLLGSLVSFTVLRSVLLSSSIGRKLTRIDILRDSRQWRAMEKAVGRKGLSMAILVR